LTRVQLKAERVDGVQVLRITGELDKLAIDQARSRLEQLVGSGRLVVDLDAVTFIDSAGLHALFGLARLASLEGGRIALVVAEKSPTARVIDLVHLPDVVPVLRTVADAVSALGQVSREDGTG
jgi:anti-sigma B factor antagonist